jgi:hypothetical protein
VRQGASAADFDCDVVVDRLVDHQPRIGIARCELYRLVQAPVHATLTGSAHKKLEPSPALLLALLLRWRDEAVRAGRCESAPKRDPGQNSSKSLKSSAKTPEVGVPIGADRDPTRNKISLQGIKELRLIRGGVSLRC